MPTIMMPPIVFRSKYVRLVNGLLVFGAVLFLLCACSTQPPANDDLDELLDAYRANNERIEAQHRKPSSNAVYGVLK
ncbi:MAG: hypothetical protein R3F37_05895 [Candidatus Competibacteraceae bacterium]